MDNYRPRLEKLYNDEFRSSLKDQFNYKNELMIPKLEKVVLNMGIGEAVFVLLSTSFPIILILID